MRLIEHKTALYGIQIFLRTNIDTDLSSGYGDVAVAAYGIVKKIDQLPLCVSTGLYQGQLPLCVSTGLYQGFMPLVSYNYAAKNYKRMKDVAVFSWKTSIVITALFVVCFATFSREILGEFIDDAQTAALGRAAAVVEKHLFAALFGYQRGQFLQAVPAERHFGGRKILEIEH